MNLELYATDLPAGTVKFNSAENAQETLNKDESCLSQGHLKKWNLIILVGKFVMEVTVRNSEIFCPTMIYRN